MKKRKNMFRAPLIGLLLLTVLVYLVKWHQDENFLSTSGREEITYVVLNNLDANLRAYRIDTGSYPTTAQGLMALYKAPPGVRNWRGPYLLPGGTVIPPDGQYEDPWGHYYQYACPGVHYPHGYDLWSLGLGPGNSTIIGNW
jgi:general secretion pathway protein G